MLPIIPTSRRAWETVVLFAVALAAAGCGGSPAGVAPYSGDQIIPDTPEIERGVVSDDGGACGAVPATGCPCDVEEETIECGQVHQQFGDYIRCSPAFRTCRSGTWGRCSSDRVVGAP